MVDRDGASIAVNLSDGEFATHADGRIVVATDPRITAEHGEVRMPAESAVILVQT